MQILVMREPCSSCGILYLKYISRCPVSTGRVHVERCELLGAEELSASVTQGRPLQ